MSLLRDTERQQVQQLFAALADTVKLVMFTQETECDFCAETRELVEELASLSDKVEAEVYDFVADKEKADSYGIDKIPAIAIIGARDYGVRYYGIPSGYEFRSLVEDIVDVSRGESGLTPRTREFLAQLKEPLHFQVFVTPT